MTLPNRIAAARSCGDLIAALGLELGITPQEPSMQRRETAAAAVGLEDFARICQTGERNPHLARIAGRILGATDDVQLATDICLALNGQYQPPLSDDEVRQIVSSIARGHARRHPADANADTPLFDLPTAGVRRFLRNEAPPRQWVLENCLPLGKAALLVAPGGTGKSQLLLQMAYDVAVGSQRRSPWRPAGAGKVVILSAEDEEEELHRRFRRLAREDLTSSDGQSVVRLLEENLFVVPRVGEDNLLTREKDRTVAATNLGRRITKSLEGIENVRLIVLDPLSRFRGGDENAAEAATRCVEALETLAKGTGAAVLAAHHTNKLSLSAGTEPSQNAARGSSALVDGVRLVINLSYAAPRRNSGTGGDGRLLDLRITKSNYGPIGEPIVLRRDSEGLLVPITAEEADARHQEEMMTLVVRTVAEEAKSARRYSKSSFGATFGGPEGKFGMGQAALKSCIDRAIAGGLLEVEVGKSKFLRVRF